MLGASTGVGGGRTESRVFPWLIPFAAVLAHLPAISAGFIWLDHAHLEDGLALVGADGWWSLFLRGFAGTGFYRPLLALSLSIDAALGGGPLLFHLVTLLWHAGAAWLCALAAESLGLSRRAAFWAALLFAVHPATSLVAGAIAFRSEAMIAVALFGVVIWHTRGKYWAAAAALFLGGLCKETALVLGALFVVALELSPSTERARPLATRLRGWAIEAAGLGLALGLRVAFAPAWRAGAQELALGDAFGTRFAAFAKSAGALLWPVQGRICDAFPVTSAAAPEALLGLTLLVALSWLAYKRRGPALLLLLALLPSLQLVPVMRWWSPHYLYVPLAFAAMLTLEAAQRWAAPALRYAGPLVVALAILAFMETSRYESDEKLWTSEVRAAPACREGHFYLGASFHAAKRLDQAGLHYERALAGTPGILSYVDRGAALQNLGVVRLEQQRFADASALFRAALALADAPEKRQLQHNLALAELGAGHPREAAELLRSEVERADAMPASIVVRARALAALGKRDEAEALLRRSAAERR